MSFDHWREKTGPVAQRHQNDGLFAADNSAAKIENMVLTAEGSLRTVVGPIEYAPTKRTATGSNLTTYKLPFDGVVHCLLAGGQRDVLLIVGKLKVGTASDIYGIWAHRGWEDDWQLLVGDDSSAMYKMSLESPEKPQFLTQFTVAPNGIIISIQNRRPLFYDGYTVGELGYTQVPAPPIPHGPKTGIKSNSTDDEQADVPNSRGYAHRSVGNDVGTTWGNNRLGFINRMQFASEDAGGFFSPQQNPMGGVLEPGEWRAKVQWIDRWGNLSPLSTRSAPVTCSREENLTLARRKDEAEDAARMRFAVAWSDLAIGPEGTVGRVLARTRDLVNSGIPEYFEVPAYATESSTTFATIEDNMSTLFPDNTPDSWLTLPVTEVDPIPLFRMSAVSMGRLWVANYGEGVSRGAIRASMPGRWGTFQTNDVEIYPDAQGSQVTAIHSIAGGLLAFTEESVFLITLGSEGEGFRAATLSNTIGCVGPNAIATLSNGTTIWLSRNGVFSWDGENLTEVSAPIRRRLKRLNKTWLLRSVAAVDGDTGEFRLWVPEDGSTKNNLCLVYDGMGWRERNDVKAHAVCTTRDERQLMLALGTCKTSLTSAPGISDHNSLWVMDHETSAGPRTKRQNTAIMETHWLRSTKSNRKASPHDVTIWLREAGDGDSEISIDVMRDWRDSPKVHTETRKMRFTSEDPPLRWDTDVLAGTKYNNYTRKKESHTWRERRAYWTKINVVIPSCEVFKIRLTGTGDWEYVAMEYSETDRDSGKAKEPQGRSDR